MLRSTFFAAILSPALVLAVAIDRRNVCEIVDPVIAILHAYPPASSFCSSFLGIKTITAVRTSTATSVFTSPVTTILPTTITTLTLTATPVTEYSSFFTTTTTCIPSLNQKRNIKKTSTSCFSKTTSTSTSSIHQATSVSNNCAGLPPVLELIACDSISTACDCLSIATPTVTSTAFATVFTTAVPTVTVYSSVTATITITGTTTIPTTSTSTVLYCPTPTLCGNQGIQWAYYGNEPYGDEIVDMDATYVKDVQPDYQSTTTQAGGIDEQANGDISIYGSTQTFPDTYFVLNHKGYIFAETTGTFTFSTSNVDDIVFLWLGSDAYSGWTGNPEGGNDAFRVTLGNSGTATYDLVQGEYLPFRIIFGQQGGPVEFFFTITAPDGTVILSYETPNSPYIVQYSCDGILAPAFPQFGSET